MIIIQTNKKFHKTIAMILMCVIIIGIFTPIHQANAGAEGIFGDFSPITWVAIVGNAIAGNILVPISGLFVSAAAMLFNTSVEYSINNETFRSGGKDNTFIDIGWKVTRDIANMFFIFILITIAISMILRVEKFGSKQLLVNLIVIAIVINFSLVITRTVIDLSNIIALEFYNGIESKMTKNGKDKEVKDIAAVFMTATNLTSVFSDEGLDDTVKNPSISPVYMPLISNVFGSGLMLVVAFVLFAAAILFVVRTIALMFYMVLAPAAFLAAILPNTKQYFEKWWSGLFSQAFFAPFYMVLFFITAQMIQGTANGGTWAKAFINPTGAAAVGLIFNYVLFIGFLIGSLVIAKNLGGGLASTSLKWAHSARKWGQGVVGRNTIGRGASLIARSQMVKNALGSRIGGALGGRYISQGLQATAGSSFGGKRGGYAGAVKQTKERQEEFAKYIGGGEGGAKRQAAYAARLRGGEFKQGVAKYTGIGAAAQQSAKPVKEMFTKTAAKENRAKELIKDKEKLAELQKKNIQTITNIDTERLKKIKEEIKESESGKMGASLIRGDIEKLKNEAGEIRERQEHHENIKRLQEKIKNDGEKEEKSEELEKALKTLKALERASEEVKEESTGTENKKT